MKEAKREQKCLHFESAIKRLCMLIGWSCHNLHKKDSKSV